MAREEQNANNRIFVSELVMSTAQDAVGDKSVIGQNARGEITGFSHLANRVNGLAAIEFVEAVAQLHQWDIDCAGY